MKKTFPLWTVGVGPQKFLYNALWTGPVILMALGTIATENDALLWAKRFIRIHTADKMAEVLIARNAREAGMTGMASSGMNDAAGRQQPPLPSSSNAGTNLRVNSMSSNGNGNTTTIGGNMNNAQNTQRQGHQDTFPWVEGASAAPQSRQNDGTQPQLARADQYWNIAQTQHVMSDDEARDLLRSVGSYHTVVHFLLAAAIVVNTTTTPFEYLSLHTRMSPLANLLGGFTMRGRGVFGGVPVFVGSAFFRGALGMMLGFQFRSFEVQHQMGRFVDRHNDSPNLLGEYMRSELTTGFMSLKRKHQDKPQPVWFKERLAASEDFMRRRAIEYSDPEFLDLMREIDPNFPNSVAAAARFREEMIRSTMHVERMPNHKAQ